VRFFWGSFCGAFFLNFFFGEVWVGGLGFVDVR